MVDVASVPTERSRSFSRWTVLRIGLGVAWVALLVGAMTLGNPSTDPTEASVIGVWGMNVPTWLGVIAVAYLLLGAASIFEGPEPWRATRWAWFWLSSSPIGWLAYLLLSGPTPPIPTPSPNKTRLAGGWAFIISCVLGGISFKIGLP